MQSGNTIELVNLFTRDIKKSIYLELSSQDLLEKSN